MKILIPATSYITILRMITICRQSARWIFRVVLVLPPAATWSRARHVGPGGQPPIRSRSKPWGIPEASDALYSKLQHDNRTAEISTWFTEQSLLCQSKKLPSSTSSWRTSEGLSAHILELVRVGSGRRWARCPLGMRNAARNRTTGSTRDTLFPC